MKRSQDPGKRLLTRTEVAQIFGVSPATVTRWGESGRLPSVKTLGGHRRYEAEVVMRLAQQLIKGEARMEHTLLTVPKMYADHHVIAVRQVLTALPGVVDVYASSAWYQVQVTYDPAKLSANDIVRALEQAGYPPDTRGNGKGEIEALGSPSPVPHRKDPAWDELGVRVTTTNRADLEMSGEFRRY